MKAKTKGTITSIFGVIFLLISVSMLIARLYLSYEFTNMEILTVLGIGYVFLRADDDLINKMIFRNDKTS